MYWRSEFGRLFDLVAGAEVPLVWLFALGACWIALACLPSAGDARVFGGSSSGSLRVRLLVAGAIAIVVGLAVVVVLMRGFDVYPASVMLALREAVPHHVGWLLGVVAAVGSAWLLRSSLAFAVGVVLLLALPFFCLPLVASDFEERVLPEIRLREDAQLFVRTDAGGLPSRHPNMVRVPAGPFIMGSLDSAQLRDVTITSQGDEHPVRSFYLDEFYIQRTEVTNAEFRRFVEATGYVTDIERLGTGHFWGERGWESGDGLSWRMLNGDVTIAGRDDHPVGQVSWNDAKAYCEWSGLRLPTEFEWEKAARGPDGRIYPWGNEWDGARLNYCDVNCPIQPERRDMAVDDGYATTSPVGSYPDGASPYGALDMVGNVWEWVADYYDPHYYTYAPAENPRGPRSYRYKDGERVVRGGSFTSEIDYVRTSSRSFDPQTMGFAGVGIRCASDD